MAAFSLEFEGSANVLALPGSGYSQLRQRNCKLSPCFLYSALQASFQCLLLLGILLVFGSFAKPFQLTPPPRPFRHRPHRPWGRASPLGSGGSRIPVSHRVCPASDSLGLSVRTF